MSIRAQDAVNHYRQRRQQAEGAAKLYQRNAVIAQQAGGKAKKELDAASLELAAAYLPGLTHEWLQRCEQLTGFVGFRRRDPFKAMDHERHTLEHTVARVAQDSRYQQRDIFAGPDGTLRAKIAEANEMKAPFKDACDKFEVLPMFDELVRVGYDTPDFKEPWWSSKYWKYWAAGDEICSQLKMTDFGDDVLPAYQKDAVQRDFWQRELDQLQAQLTAIHELVRQHDQAQARLPQLPRIYLEQCRRVLAQHLMQADTQLLEEWRNSNAAADRSLQIGLRKLSGLRAKFEILQELHEKSLQAMVTDLESRASKYQRKVVKFSRRKYQHRSINERELDHKFGTKLKKLNQRQQKLSALIARIDRYNDYDRFDLLNDQELWWHELTGGKRPPQQLNRWRRYYDRHPSVSPRRDKNKLPKAVQRAAATIPLADDLGYLS